MRKHAQQRIGGEAPLFLQRHDGEREYDAGAGDAEREVDRQQEAERHTQQGGMGKGIAEIGHVPPHDETAERARDKGKADPAEKRIDQEALDHHPRTLLPPPPLCAPGSGWP